MMLKKLIFVALVAGGALVGTPRAHAQAPAGEPTAAPTPTAPEPAPAPAPTGEPAAAAPAPTPAVPAAAAEPQDTAKGEHAVEGAAAEGGEGGEEAEDPTQHFNFFNFSYGGKDEVGGKFGDGKNFNEQTGEGTKGEEEPMSPPFLFMAINFGLFLLVLAKWGRPAAKKLAEDRHDQIKSALDEATKLREAAAAKLAEYETRIKDVDADVQKLVDGIRADAEADKKRILENAEKQAAQLKKDAELRIAAEIETARAQLTREVTAAAVKATEQLLRDKATTDDQQKLVTTFIAGLGSASSQQEAR